MCKCANDNCNCTSITLPSIPGPPGPQGPRGPQGIQGPPGADAGNVIDTEINFGGISSSGLRRWVPSILVEQASEFHKNENRLKVRAVFKTEEIESLGQYSVFLSNNDDLTNAVEIINWVGFYPTYKYFYLEFYIDKWSSSAINIIGRACFVGAAAVGNNLFPITVPADDYFIFATNFSVAPVDINQDFRIILATTDTAGVQPVYFTAEYIVRK